jgi:hypothetical protein
LRTASKPFGYPASARSFLALAGSYATRFETSTKYGLSGSTLDPRTFPYPNIAPFSTSSLLMACVMARRTRLSEYGFFVLLSDSVTSFVVSPRITWNRGSFFSSSTLSGPRPKPDTSASPALSAASAEFGSGMKR